jgi:transposase-like protein/transposase
MSHTIHRNARTTPQTRREIRESTLSDRALAKQYNITRATAKKWKNRPDEEDRSHRPHKLHTTLTPTQEAMVVIIRTTLLLPLDDLLAVTKEFINPKVSRSGLNRLLTRENISNLQTLKAQQTPEEEKPVKKGFKDYKPGYFHVDIKYLPKMPDQTQRSYLFVAIDRATRWVFVRVYADQSECSATDFLYRLNKASPVKIEKILTDNGTQFTDRFRTKDKKPTGKHGFDKACTDLKIEHRLTPPRTPQMNGMVERFNGRISELLTQTRFASIGELVTTLGDYEKIYNHQIPQKALGGVSPVQSMKHWQKSDPDLFIKKVYNQAGLDIYRSSRLISGCSGLCTILINILCCSIYISA